MPRPLRNEEAGAIWQVVARGVERRRTFVDDHDYETYVRLLGSAVRRQGWNLLAYSLMPNHMHLLIETPQPNLGAGIQWLHGLYAATFNDRHSRVGHLFQGRFKSPRIKDDAALLRAVPYVIRNPVAAGLCHQPEEWRWGSHASVKASELPTWVAHGRLLALLDETTGSRCYDRLITAAST